MSTPLDIIGNGIAVGDTVVFGQGQHMNLLMGTVIAINPKTVRIEHETADWDGRQWVKRLTDSLRTFENVVIVTKGANNDA